MLAPPAMPQSSASDALASALADLNRGFVLEAIGKLKEIVRDQPAFGAPHFYLSTIYTEMGEYEIASGYLNQALRTNPEQGAYHHQSGMIAYRQKRWHEALAAFETALKFGVGRDEGLVWRSIGNVHIELFDREKALEGYLIALKFQPRDARTRMALGKFYLERNETKRAVAELKAALDLNPALDGVHAALGRAYRRSGNVSSAVETLKKAIESDPSDQDSRYILGQTLLEMRRFDEARKALEEYQRIQQQVSKATASFDAGEAFVQTGDLERAEKLLTEAVEAAPAYGPGLYLLGKVLLDRGKPEKAVTILRRAVSRNPLHAPSHFSLAAAHRMTGNLAEASKAMSQALLLDSRFGSK